MTSRHPYADRRRAATGQPAEPTRGVREDQRVGAGQQGAGDHTRTTAKLRNGVEQDVHVCRDESCRLLLVAALEPVEPPHRRLAVRVGTEAVHRVRGHHRRLTPADGRDDLVDQRRRPSTTRSWPARSSVVVDLVVAELTQARGHRRSLAVADLEHEHPARREDVLDGGRDHLVPPEPDQRLARLAEHLRRQPVDVSRRDIRRVRDDEVERACCPRDQVAVTELDPPVHAEPEPVRLGDGERTGRGIGRDDAGIGPLVHDRERDRAGADADVEHAGAVEAGEQLEAALDEDLGLGPRDQHARIDLERQAAEAPLAEDVRKRLPRPPSLDE